MTGMAKLNANSESPRVAASSNARSRAASQPIRTMPKIGAMISTTTAMAASPAPGRRGPGYRGGAGRSSGGGPQVRPARPPIPVALACGRVTRANGSSSGPVPVAMLQAHEAGGTPAWAAGLPSGKVAPTEQPVLARRATAVRA
jgi:hypothetical protein